MRQEDPTNFWLIRHPEPDVEFQGRCYGALDLALSPAGLLQARDIANALREQPFAAIYTSPLRRCREAAEILACGRACPVQSMPELAELDFGEFEGRSYDEIAATYPDLYREWMEHPTEVSFPGGESFARMWMRITAAGRLLRELHRRETIAVVTHAGPIRILVAEALGIAPANIFRIAQRYGAVSMIRYFGEMALVETLNIVLPGYSPR